MKQKLTLKDLENYINEFNYWRDKRLHWTLRTFLYLPFGVIIENYWIYKMGKVNSDYEKRFITN